MAQPGESDVPSTRVGMLLFPALTQLDLTGPYEILARLPDTQVLLVADDRRPVRSDSGLILLPDASLEEAPPLDVVFVPGGPGVGEAMQSDRLLDFLRLQGGGATWVTAVCTGSLVLGAAGLLKGYRATAHWLSVDLLEPLGAIPVRGERVVVDRNRITAGGVTAGIDFALALAARLRGEAVARELQLTLEYDPAPPFDSGSPRTAAPELVEKVTVRRAALQTERRALVERLSRELGLRG
ncbi:MAG TPA: DJ-1/PfpI family protein [Myxococcales bacterium]|nr:DJ-1/PfpI family protein [Myxococcales bacterium]